MITVLSISAFIFAAYIAAIIALFGVPASISDSFYLLERKKEGVGSLFTVWCFITGVSVMAMMFQLSAGSWYQFLGLFAGGGLGFVGSAPHFKLHFERPVHFVAAGTCAVASMIWVILSGYWTVPLVFILSAIAVIKLCKGMAAMFWLEIACFASMYLTLFLIVL